MNVNGNGAIPNGSSGVGIFGGAQSNTLGGTAPGAGNVISGNTFQGLTLGDPGTSGNLIQGNYFGLDASGLTSIGNNSSGIDVVGGAHDNVIGGTAAGARNYISASMYYGVTFGNSGTNSNLLQGNTIGLNIAGAAAGNGLAGILLSGGAQSNVIGGTSSGMGNIIAFSNGPGVALLDPTTTQNAINRNAIFSNSQIGIDLNWDGVTGNDGCDADTGTNNVQNFPVITSASFGGGNVTLSGTLNSTASTTFRLEFFSNSACDGSGNGEGQAFLGSTNVTTAGNCTCQFRTADFSAHLWSHQCDGDSDRSK